MTREMFLDALNGEFDWFDPNKDLTEEDFRNQIRESIQRSKNNPAYLQPIEENAELVINLMKLTQLLSKAGRSDDGVEIDPDLIFHIHEEIGDVLWGLGYLIERYYLSETHIKQIHRLKMEINRRRDQGLEI